MKKYIKHIILCSAFLLPTSLLSSQKSRNFSYLKALVIASLVITAPIVGDIQIQPNNHAQLKLECFQRAAKICGPIQDEPNFNNCAAAMGALVCESSNIRRNT